MLRELGHCGCSLVRLLIVANPSERRFFSMFLSTDGRVLGVTARHLWDVLLSVDLEIKEYISGDRATELWSECFHAAEREGQPV